MNRFRSLHMRWGRRLRLRYRRFVFVVVPLSAIKEMVAFDLIGSSLLYAGFKKGYSIEWIAIAGSTALPMALKQAYRIAIRPSGYRVCRKPERKLARVAAAFRRPRARAKLNP